eukprot:GGOE01038307.1.p1 GENE.GGOE01038307.1~~GGOE01038307.1.p1  ORF type:complete len:144 (+),score=31.89 GGOE01038307.1:40-471(+)
MTLGSRGQHQPSSTCNSDNSHPLKGTAHHPDTIDPLSRSIRTLVFGIPERDLTLTWGNMHAHMMAQRRLWDVGVQPMHAFAQREPLARLMWPVLASNSKLLLLVVFTLTGDSLELVAAINHPDFGMSVGLQNGTHRWIEGWDF